MKTTKIAYADTGFFNKTVLDYMEGAPALQPFYPYPPDADAVPGIIRNIKAGAAYDRKGLVAAIDEQYRNAGCAELPLKLSANIAALADENTFTVTTAHQLNLFGGPLYYILKIANTLRVARDLQKRYPEYTFVPCYWMGSEDHDFEEVNHTWLFNKKIEWKNFQGGPMGTYATDGITGLLPEVRDILRSGPHLDELMALLEEAYSHPKLADAVRHLLLGLFGASGLVVIDGSCRPLKRIFGPVLKDELTHGRSADMAGRTIEALESAGYKAQAGPREINLFFTEGRVRERIVAAEDGFALADGSRGFPGNSLIELVDSEPEKFSPNVILRPLHQQMVLPNVAYIGGGSEVAYWLQLSGLFAHYGIHFPMLLMRTSVQYLLPHHLKKMEKLGLSLTDIFKDAEVLKKEFVARNQDLDLELPREKEAVDALFRKLSEKAANIDPTLEGWVGAEGQKAYKSIENISKRLVKAEKQRNDLSMQQIDKFKEQLFPEGQLAERRENFMPFYAGQGKDWLNTLVDTLDPFEQKFTLIY